MTAAAERQSPIADLDGSATFELSAGARARLTVVTFTATSLLGSTLLFLVQPLVGRLLLPRAGGSASLWNTAMVFFQVTLLAGYLLAHFSSSRLGVRRHRWFQLMLLALPLLVLPLHVPGGWSLDADRPVLGTLGVLTVMVGVPFLALSTASPTLQRWFAETDHPHRDDPYFLYAAGNVGAIGALIGYPLVIEPRLGLVSQTQLFTGLYVALIVGAALCGMLTGTRGRDELGSVATSTAVEANPVTWEQRLRWLMLAAVPSALLLGVTRFISTDIASFPLLWAVPLALYLLSFVVAFGDRSERRLPTIALLVRVGAFGLVLSFLGLPFFPMLLLHLAWFFAATTLVHLRLAVARPPAADLTEFYAWMSAGGALGGGLVALVAPIVFDRVWEYPIAILAAVALAGVAPSPFRAAAKREARSFIARVRVPLTVAAVGSLLVVGALARADEQLRLPAAALGIAGLLAYVTTQRPSLLAGVFGAMLVTIIAFEPTDTIHRDRSFFGTYEVREQDDGIALVMGTTKHGEQRFDRPGEPSTYYHPDGPLGEVFARPGREPLSAGIVGLGAGEIAAYGQPGDTMTFYEIDPVVVDIATDGRFFTHVADSPATTHIEVGDGRLLLADTTDQFGVVVVDAFSSDSIPVHLLTVEAVETYLARADDVVLLHISNHYFDLEGPLGRIGEELDVEVLVNHYQPVRASHDEGASASHWVALLPADSTITLGDQWRPAVAEGRLWTDDYSDILGALK